MDSYWIHYGLFNQFQFEHNEFSVVLLEFCYHVMVTLWSSLTIIVEFLLSFLHHIVGSVWRLKILIQNFDTTIWSFHGVPLPDSGIFLFNFNTIQ